MSVSIPRLTTKQAQEYTRDLKALATHWGCEVEDFILLLGRTNDIKLGDGPRHAIVAFAQTKAAEGATYGQVLNQWVMGGNGCPHKITTRDLAGFVCANGFCKLVPPGAER